MSVYDRANSLPEEVLDLRNTISEIKQTQIIGNDNLRINLYAVNLMPAPFIVGGTTVVIKMTFTFDEPSNSYIIPRIRFSLTGGVSYNENFYTDPTSVDSSIARSWFYTITPTSDTTLFMSFSAYCADSGTSSIVRIS